MEWRYSFQPLLDRYDELATRKVRADAAMRTETESTVAIRASGNVSSITDNGTGDYTVNFTNAMPDTNYAAASYAHSNSDGSGWIRFVSGPASSVPKTTASFRITTVNVGWGNTDTNQIDVSIFR